MPTKNPTYAQKRKWLLSTRYGITPGCVDALRERQGGVCGICGNGMQRVCVDHSHETNVVRGLLCHRCNIGLPYVEDVAFREAALRYLASAPTERADDSLPLLVQRD